MKSMRAMVKNMPSTAVLIGMLAVVTNVQGDILARYDFTGEVNTSSDTNDSSTASAFTWTGLNQVSFTSGIAGNPSPGISVRSDGTPASQDLGSYFSFVVTPDSGGSLWLQGASLTLDYAKGTAQTLNFNWALRSSVDSFASDLTIGSSSSQTWQTSTYNITRADFNDLSSVEYRIYVWDDSNQVNRRANLDNIILEGTVVSVPEPAPYALAAFGLMMIAGLRIGRYCLARRRVV